MRKGESSPRTASRSVDCPRSGAARSSSWRWPEFRYGEGSHSRLGLRGANVHQRRNVMHIIWTLIVGLIVGAIAKLLMPGRDPGGFIITMLLGIAGAFVAGFI